jgi:trehalose 6-phosphate phosphatase
MVVEVKPAAAHKGAAVVALWRHLPFAGRRPVIMGDDATDEDAMRVALDLGGVAVKVGPGESIALLRATDPAMVRAWLEQEVSSA